MPAIVNWNSEHRAYISIQLHGGTLEHTFQAAQQLATQVPYDPDVLLNLSGLKNLSQTIVTQLRRLPLDFIPMGCELVITGIREHEQAFIKNIIFVLHPALLPQVTFVNDVETAHTYLDAKHHLPTA